MSFFSGKHDCIITVSQEVKTVNFENLNDVDFENFCYDLLQELGLQNVNWRKGTGKKSSPSDNGRDIECEYHKYDPLLQKTIIEKWFVECKHYSGGVPYERIQNAIAWATAERPDRLIIITSNFLSNPCKNAIQQYISTNKPAFAIEMWERAFLANKLHAYPALLKKYGIEHRETLFDHFHPTHIDFMKRSCCNTVKQLFAALDLLSPVTEEEIGFSFFLNYVGERRELDTINPSTRYINVAKKMILELADCTSDLFAVRSFIVLTLHGLSSHQNFSADDQFVWSETNVEKMIDKMYSILPSKDDEMFSELRKMLQRTYAEACEDHVRRKDVYNEFCEKTLGYLLEHQVYELLGSTKDAE